MAPGDSVRVEVPLTMRAGYAVGGVLMLAVAMVPASLLIFSGVSLGVSVFLAFCTLLLLPLVWGYAWAALGSTEITADAGRVLMTRRILGVPGRTVYERVRGVYLIDVEQRGPWKGFKIVTRLVIRSGRKLRYLNSQSDCGNLEEIFGVISSRVGGRSLDLRGGRVFGR